MLALTTFVPHDHLARQQVDHTSQAATLIAIGELQRNSDHTEALFDHVHCLYVARLHSVELVDEGDARDVITIGLSPYGLRLRLYHLYAGEDYDASIENAQGTFDLCREVNVPWGIDDVNPMLAPETRRRRRGDSNSPLTFLRHPVHFGVTLMDLAHLVRTAGIVEDPFCDRCLPGIDVSHDADIPYPLHGHRTVIYRSIAGHRDPLH